MTAKKTRVERWAEASGNAGLAGRELPPAQVLAADQRVTAWAKELRKAGLEGGIDALRARAYLDILLGMDSRPLGSRTDGTCRPQDPAQPQGPAPAPGPGGPLAGMIPPGFAGQVTLTVPEATVTGRADRPGELGGIGPVDPDLARDLAAAATRNPRSTWCVTVTDSQGHAIGHGCARPVKRRKPDGHDPPGDPRFTFTPTDQPGPPGGYGTWRFVHRAAGPAHRDRSNPHRGLRPPVAGPGPRSRGHAAAPDRGPQRHLYRARLSAARGQVRFRAQRSVRGRRSNMFVQRRAEVPPRPPDEARPAVDGRAASRRIRPVDCAVGAAARHRADPLPHLNEYRVG